MSDPNPFDDPGPFGFIYFDDVLVACTLVEIDGATKPEDWHVTKGSGSDGATADWKGTKLAEKVKTKFRASDGPMYDAMRALYKQARPKLGQKPPSLTVSNEIINSGEIYKLRLVEPAQPKWVPEKQCWDFEWEWGEHSPSKPTKTGPSDPAKPESTAAGGGAQSPAEKELADLLKTAKGL